MSKARKKVITNTTTWKDITPGGIIYDAGNAEDFKTGDWRSEKPIWLQDKCKQCLLCFPVRIVLSRLTKRENVQTSITTIAKAAAFVRLSARLVQLKWPKKARKSKGGEQKCQLEID